MRKLLLAFSCLVVFANNSQAQINFSDVFDKQIALPRPVADAASKDLVTITNSGELYAVGNFTKKFSFGNSYLEAVANSAYIIKYDALGNEKWGAIIQGAVNPTSITTDNAGNLYVAGTFAEAIVLIDINGNTLFKEGVAGTTEKAASFIAKFSPDGVLLKAESLLPTALPVGDLMTLDPSFATIEQIKFENNKLYASITTKGGEVTQNGIKLNGAFQNSGGWLAASLQYSHIVSLNNDLLIDKLVFSAGATSNIDKASNAITPRFTFGSDGKMYAGFVGSGDINLTIGSTNKTLNFTYNAEGQIGYNGVITEINLSDMSNTTKSFETTNDITNLFKIKDLSVYSNKLIVSGTFNSTLAFDNTLAAVKKNDTFVTALNLADLTHAWSKKSSIDEGDATKNEEVLVNSVITGNKMILGINTKVGGETNNTLTSGIMVCDLTAGTLGAINNGNAGEYLTGMASKNSLVAYAKSTNAGTGTLVFAMSKNNDISTGISNTTSNNGVKVYPTVATDNINFSEVCDVTITSISGSIVAKSSNVNSLSVSSLSAGIYFVTVSTDHGTQTTKIVKR